MRYGLIRNQAFGKATSEEEYLPSAARFEFCGNAHLRNEAKAATTVVLRALREMFKREKKRIGTANINRMGSVRQLLSRCNFGSVIRSLLQRKSAYLCATTVGIWSCSARLLSDPVWFALQLSTRGRKILPLRHKLEPSFSTSEIRGSHLAALAARRVRAACVIAVPGLRFG